MNVSNEPPHRQYSVINEEGFRDMVAMYAYFKYADRGFRDGCALQDWLEAEKEVTTRCFYWVHDIE